MSKKDTAPQTLESYKLQAQKKQFILAGFVIALVFGILGLVAGWFIHTEAMGTAKTDYSQALTATVHQLKQ